jgi:hypothetical protein
VHSDPALNTPLFAVSVSVAVDVPDFVSAAVNAVEPHPLDVLSPPAVPMVNVGSTSAMVSVVGSSGAFNSNWYDTEDDVYVVGLTIVSLLMRNEVFEIGIDILLVVKLWDTLLIPVLLLRMLSFISPNLLYSL